jgi:hypothetical protein
LPSLPLLYAALARVLVNTRGGFNGGHVAFEDLVRLKRRRWRHRDAAKR